MILQYPILSTWTKKTCQATGKHLSHLLPGSLDNPFHRIHPPDFAEGADNGIELLNAADSKSNLYNGCLLYTSKNGE